MSGESSPGNTKVTVMESPSMEGKEKIVRSRYKIKDSENMDPERVDYLRDLKEKAMASVWRETYTTSIVSYGMSYGETITPIYPNERGEYELRKYYDEMIPVPSGDQEISAELILNALYDEYMGVVNDELPRQLKMYFEFPSRPDEHGKCTFLKTYTVNGFYPVNTATLIFTRVYLRVVGEESPTEPIYLRARLHSNKLHREHLDDPELNRGPIDQSGLYYYHGEVTDLSCQEMRYLREHDCEKCGGRHS